MKYAQLGASALQVSRVCLGSMTWGIQNNQQDADAQINFALEQGVNFIDTAEMYPVPPGKETYGGTEAIIGHYLASNPHRRKDIVLATKIAGSGLHYIREGGPITGEAVVAAVDASLKRLQTDYIDLYQLHWPNRTTPHFAKHASGRVKFSELDREREVAGMDDILTGLQHCLQQGKIRHWGLSDDTPWGISEYLKLAQQANMPPPVSIQNEFSLIHLKDWPYLIEFCVHNDIAYLPWSPLGGGVLSGKYAGDQRPAGSRWTLMQRNGLFRDTPAVHQAVQGFAHIAAANNMTASQLALAWVDQVDGVTSTIIGATSMAQLEENISAFAAPLSAEVVEQVHEVVREFPQPF